MEESRQMPPEEAAPKLNFIRDVAANVDFFGSHDRVAKAIAQVIATNDDLKVIGLLGRWGSGKSTVVKHVQTHLNATDQTAGGKTHVFCYDAWLHQSDPPRRSFLETLVAFLVEEKLTTQERWQLQLDILNRQIEDTTTTSTPALTKMGIVLLLSLALIPLGMHFIGHDWYTAALAAKAGLFERHAFRLGWILLAVPPLLAIIVAWRGNPDDGSILALFVNRQVHKQANRIIRTPDPTTIEFQRLFRQIIAAIEPKHRLIFVIDNLDRLHETEAVDMWNTIRSFFLGSEHADRKSRGAELPTVLLPIDQDAVERIYSKDHGAELGKRLARSFMDKTFDLTFHVSPPVLSDWNLYINAQLEAVFGDWVESTWAYQVGRLYEAHSRGGHDVTPRGINVTINDIATLWLQWRGEIPFVTIAYFVVFRETVEKNIYEAVGAPIVSIADIDPDWQRGLAALYFGAPRDKAIQVLIEPRLRSAIDRWNVDEFRVLAALPGFPETLQRVLDGARPGHPRFVSRVSYLLSQLSPEPAAWTNAAQSGLREAYVQGQPYEDLDNWDAEALKAMLSQCPDPLLPSFIRGVTARLSQAQDPAFSASGEDARKVYVTMVQALVEAGKTRGVPDVSVRFQGAAESYLTTIQYAADKADAAGALEFSGEDQKLADALTTQLTSTASATVEAKFRALMLREVNANWDPLLDRSRALLVNNTGSDPGLPSAIAILGRFWQTSDAAKKAVRDLAGDGTLNARIAECNHPSRYSRLARLTALAILSQGALDNPGSTTWETLIKTVPSLVGLVREALDEFDSSGYVQQLVKLAQTSPHALPLCKAIVSGKIETRTLGGLPLTEVFDQLPLYLKCIDDEKQRHFIAQIAEYPAFWEKLGARTFDDNTRRILRSLATGGLASDTAQKAAKTSLKSHLRTVPTATWVAAVQSGNEPSGTAQALAGTSPRPLNVGKELFDALTSLLPALLVDPQPAWASRWFDAAGWLSLTSRKALHQNLRDGLLAGSAAVSLPALLTSAGERFFVDADLPAHSDRVVRHLVSPMLTSDGGRAWLAGHQSEVKLWVAKAPSDSRAFLKERIKHTLRDLDFGGRKRLRAFGRDLGL